MSARPALVADPALVTSEWLTDVLRHGGAIGDATKVTSFGAKAIGTGQVGANVRYQLAYEGTPGPASIVCKFSARDPQSAATGVQSLNYESEVAFYRCVAETVDVSRPHCYFAEVLSGTADVVLVMEDLAPAEQGDQLAGCTVAEAMAAVDEAAKLHGPRWGYPAPREMPWLDGSSTQGLLIGMLGTIWDAFVERYRTRLDPVTLEAGPQIAVLAPKLLSIPPAALTLVHSDFRLDNMLFGGSRPLVVVDWQTLQLGVGPSDVAYFLGSAFDTEVRRSCERELVTRYHRSLVDDYGVSDYPFDRCWDDYVRASYASLLMAACASMVVGRTDRGDAMFMAMANRSAQMAADLDAPTVINAVS